MVNRLLLALAVAAAARSAAAYDAWAADGYIKNGGFEISEVTCDRNNGGKFSEPYVLVAHVTGANAHHMVAIRGSNDQSPAFETSLVCAEWERKDCSPMTGTGGRRDYDGHIELINFSPTPEVNENYMKEVQADGSGYAKFRLPIDSCDVNINLVATQANLDGNSMPTGSCEHTDMASLGEVIGAVLVLKFPLQEHAQTDDSQRSWNSDRAQTFEHQIEEFTYSHVWDHDNLHAEDVIADFTFTNFFHANNFVACVVNDESDCQNNAPDFTTNDGSVFVWVAVPAVEGGGLDRFEAAMKQIKRARMHWSHGDDGSWGSGEWHGLGRRSNDHGSQAFADALDAQGHKVAAVELMDSNVLRERTSTIGGM